MAQTHGKYVPMKLFKFNALLCPLFGLLTPSGGPQTILTFPVLFSCIALPLIGVEA